MSPFEVACRAALERLQQTPKGSEARREAEWKLAELMCDGLPPEPLDVRMIAAEGRQAGPEGA